MGYPSIAVASDQPTDRPPIVHYSAPRAAFTHHDRPCSVCGAPTERFADAHHADGSVSGWVPACKGCVPDPAPPAAEVA